MRIGDRYHGPGEPIDGGRIAALPCWIARDSQSAPRQEVDVADDRHAVWLAATRVEAPSRGYECEIDRDQVRMVSAVLDHDCDAAAGIRYSWPQPDVRGRTQVEDARIVEGSRR